MANSLTKSLERHVVLALLLGAATVPALFAGKKTVQVQVEITAPVLTDNLPVAELDRVKQEVEEALAEEAGEWFGFLDWGPETTRPAATLIMAITEEGQGIAQALYLDFLGRIPTPDSVQPFVVKIKAKEFEGRFDGDCVSQPWIFRSWDIPSHDSATLQRHLICHVARQMGNEDFRRELEKNWLQWVPISQEPLVAEPAQERLVLPIAWNDLQAGDDSTLRAEFEGGPVDSRLRGKMRFRPDTAVSEGIRCLVEFFSFGSIVLSEPERFWDPVFAEAFGQDHLELRVFMQHYEKHLGPATALGPF